MFQEFIRRAQEEERLRNQTYYNRKRQNQYQQSDFSGRTGRDGEHFGDFFGFGGPNQNRTGNYQKDYERAKAEERRQRAEEYERVQREQEERSQQAMKDFQDTLQKAGKSFEKGKRVAEKEGIIQGVISGVKDFFKK